MKKNNKNKEEAVPNLTRTELDLAIIMNRIENRLGALEAKIDILINRPAEKHREERNFSKPFQHGGHSNNYDKGRDHNNFRERNFFKTICADCNKECEVPFKPTGDRPVYCKECFSRRKEGGPFKKDHDNAGGNKRDFVQKSNFSKPRRGENKKFDKKKKKKGPHRV